MTEPSTTTTTMSPGAETVEDRRTLSTQDGDHERFSHYVAKDKLTEAMVMGTPVVALCGKVWVPSRAPDKFPVCPDCKENPQNLVEEFSAGDTICGSCGRVLAERTIDTRSEWRTFSNDGKYLPACRKCK